MIRDWTEAERVAHAARKAGMSAEAVGEAMERSRIAAEKFSVALADLPPGDWPTRLDGTWLFGRKRVLDFWLVLALAVAVLGVALLL